MTAGATTTIQTSGQSQYYYTDDGKKSVSYLFPVSDYPATITIHPKRQASITSLEGVEKFASVTRGNDGSMILVLNEPSAERIVIKVNTMTGGYFYYAIYGEGFTILEGDEKVPSGQDRAIYSQGTRLSIIPDDGVVLDDSSILNHWMDGGEDWWHKIEGADGKIRYDCSYDIFKKATAPDLKVVKLADNPLAPNPTDPTKEINPDAPKETEDNGKFFYYKITGDSNHLVVEQNGVAVPYGSNSKMFRKDGTALRLYGKKDVVIDKTSVLGKWRWYDQSSHRFIDMWKADGDGFLCTPPEQYFTSSEGHVFELTVMSTGPAPNVLSPFNSLFNLTSDQLMELSRAMPKIYSTGSGVSASLSDGSDDSQYIINIMVLPFKVPSSAVTGTAPVRIGAVDTKIVADSITDDSLDYDLGTIKVAGLGDSSLDYEACSFELVLPFVSRKIELDASEVIGHSISITYEVDAYSGDMTANVYSDGGEPIASVTDSIGRDIPVHTLNTSLNKLGQYITTNNGVMKAFIRVTRKEVVVSEYANLTTQAGKIGDRKGYVELVSGEVADCEHSDELIALLKNGVIVK